MILEAVAAVTSACKALEMAAGAASNIESLGVFIGRMGLQNSTCNAPRTNPET